MGALQRGLSFTLLAGFGLLVPACRSADVSAPDKDVLRYGLCPANIQEASVIGTKQTSPPSYRVFVRLTEVKAQAFARLTEQHVGNMAQIEFDGAILERTTIHTPVDEGRMMLGNWTSKEAASRIVALLLDKTLTVPCGPK